MNYMTEPQNDGKNWCEPHRWGLGRFGDYLFPFCFGRHPYDDKSFPCEDCEYSTIGWCAGEHWDNQNSVQLDAMGGLLRVYASENHALRYRVETLLNDADDSYADGFNRGFNEENFGIRQEHKKLQERIDALEWLREVESMDANLCPTWWRGIQRKVYRSIGAIAAWKCWETLAGEFHYTLSAARAAVGGK